MSPVDVIERQVGDLPTTQPQARQQLEDREVTTPSRSTAITSLEQSILFVRLQGSRQIGIPPSRRPRHRSGQLARYAPLEFQELEKATEFGLISARGTRLPATAFVQHDADHVLGCQCPQLGHALHQAAQQKVARRLRVRVHSRRHHAAFPDEVVTIRLAQLVDRGALRCRLDGLNNTDSLQVCEQRPEQPPRACPPATLASSSKELLDLPGRKFGRLQALLEHPPAEVRDGSHGFVNGPLRVPLCGQLFGKAGHMRA